MDHTKCIGFLCVVTCRSDVISLETRTRNLRLSGQRPDTDVISVTGQQQSRTKFDKDRDGLGLKGGCKCEQSYNYFITPILFLSKYNSLPVSCRLTSESIVSVLFLFLTFWPSTMLVLFFSRS